MLKEIKNEKNWSRVYDWFDWAEIFLILVAEVLAVYGLYFIILPLSLFIGRADCIKYARNRRSGAYESSSLKLLDSIVLLFQFVVLVCANLRIYVILRI